MGTREQVVRALANDPQGWMSHDNRILGHVAGSLLMAGVDIDVIYNALDAGFGAEGGL